MPPHFSSPPCTAASSVRCCLEFVSNRPFGERIMSTACGSTISEGETEFDLLTPAGVMIFLHPRCINHWPNEARDGAGSAAVRE
jgi:hypothetical protein